MSIDVRFGKRKRKPTAGIEPATFRLQGGCSTTKLKWLFVYLHARAALKPSPTLEPEPAFGVGCDQDWELRENR